MENQKGFANIIILVVAAIAVVAVGYWGIFQKTPRVDIEAFQKRAQTAGCASKLNKLFLIDNRMVYWQQASDQCSDARYANVLFGGTPDTVLCSDADSIAGPRQNCVDANTKIIFNCMGRIINGDTKESPCSGHTAVEIPIYPTERR